MCLTGCTMFGSGATLFAKREAKPETPHQIVPVWTDTVLHQPEQAPVRGFGGRIMFYGPDRNRPILIDGTLVVYAWDDSAGTLERTPDRKYVFPAESLKTHYSLSPLGHSYSFWVPWDPAGGPQQRVTLISRFVSNDGAEITSTPARLVLQGPDMSDDGSDEPGSDDLRATPFDPYVTNQKSGQDNSIRLAGHEEVTRTADRSTSRVPRRPSFNSSEISVTDGFLQRNMRGGASEAELSEESVTGYSNDFKVYESDDVVDVLCAPEPEEASAGDTNMPSRNVSGNDPASSDEHVQGSKSEAAKDSQSDRLLPFESRVRSSRSLRPSGGRVRTGPLRATSQIGLPKTPRSAVHEPEEMR